MNVGIYCPEWMVARHHKDYEVARMLGQLGAYAQLKTEFVASESYTRTFNIHLMLHRLLPALPPLVDYGIRKTEEEIDLIYHFGPPTNPVAFFKVVKDTPAFVTTGFIKAEHVADTSHSGSTGQQHADELARSLEKAAVLHFLTKAGMERFLFYRPDFKDKTVTIPLFMPGLEAAEYIRPDRSRVNILFVAHDGKNKGLFNLLDAIDLLGHDYMEIHKVAVTIVAKDKPKPKTDYRLSWYPELPHNEIIRLMKEASIFVKIPTNECYGTTLVEAMLYGCTIVTDDDELRQEIVGNTGIMLDNKSAANIARTLRVLIEDTYWRELLGQSACLRAQQLFLPETVARQYEKSFRALLQNA